jgi:hypothetical protein
VLAKPRLYAIELDCRQYIKKPSFLTKDFPDALPKERLWTTDSDCHRAVHSYLLEEARRCSNLLVDQHTGKVNDLVEVAFQM